MKRRLEILAADLERLPLEEEAKKALGQAAETVLGDEALLAAAERIYGTLYTGDLSAEELTALGDKQADEKLGRDMIVTLVILARCGELNREGAFRYRGETLDFYPSVCRHVTVSKLRTGGFGLREGQRQWGYSFSQPTAFQLGRLIFHISEYQYEFTVYRDPVSGERVPLANAGLRFDHRGLQDPDGPLVTTVDMAPVGVTGYVYGEDGRLIPEKRTLTGYEPILKAGDTVLGVHIGGEGRLEEAGVRASLEGAREFFKTYFPALDYRAFVCSSWLLDTNLLPFLGENSNIRKFQKQFCLTMGPRNSVSLRNHIFQVHPELPLEQLRPVNRFQQCILDMVKAGGTLYSGRGYILK